MRYSFLSFLLLMAFVQGITQVHYIDTVQFIAAGTKMPDHPRLLLLKGEEEQILQNIQVSKTWQSVQKEIIRQCDSLLPLPPVERILTGIRLLQKSRECLYRVFNLCYAWRTTHEKKYFDRAEKELLAVSRFSDWHPSHYLDVAEMTTAVAIGYDWLYNDLSPASRELIKNAILKKGIATSYDTAYPSYRKWLSVTNNWNQVCNTGMTLSALAIYEEDTTLAKKVINRSIASIDIPMKDYNPDGAFSEGYTYWGYGTTFNLLFLTAVKKVFKTDFGLSEQSGFLKTAGYMQNMIGPSGKCFNYSDSYEACVLQSGLFWFAQKLKDPSLIYLQQHFLANDSVIRGLSDRLFPALMIWGIGNDLKNVAPPVAKSWYGGGKNPVAMFRTSWTDPNAVYVTLKGGSPFVTHGHMDAGSFVMDAGGVRWAMDFGMQDYTALEEKNVDIWNNKQDGQRWEIFRYSNLAHNVITINNQLQKVDGYATVRADEKNSNFLNAVTDISSIYKGELAAAHRGIALIDQQYVVIRDELETGDSVTIRWSMLTPAEVKISGTHSAILTQSGKKLTLLLEGLSNAVMRTWSTSPPHSYDEVNPGTIIVGFECKVPAHTKCQYNVFLLPEKTETKKRKGVLPLSEWNPDAAQHPVLFPAPRKLQYDSGTLPLSGLSLYIPKTAGPDIRFALKELKGAIEDRTGKKIAMAVSAASASIQYIVKNDGQILPGADEKNSTREYYQIHITKSVVRIEANSSTGLYYASQTIRQLIEGSATEAKLPLLQLEDQPALPYRGVMMDFAHGGLISVEEIKRQIDFLARWKTNQYYFYNEVSINMNGYAAMNEQAGYSQEQIKEIIAYGRQRHMDVIPFVAFYGHLHDLLKLETYADLGIGHYGEELDPRNPAVATILKNWIKQYAQLFPSPFIHVGFDETWETNRISTDVDTAVRSEALWLRHLDFVQHELKQYGKTVLAWTDMNSFYPDIMTRMPKEVIPVIWEYTPDTASIHYYLDPVLKEKKPFFIQPAVSGWGHVYPASDYTYDNIDYCLQAGMKNNTLGFITSVWTDAVEPFIRPSWLFMAYGCIGAWQGTVPDKKTFTADYSRILFPGAKEEMNQAFICLAQTISTLENCLQKNTNHLPKGTIIESWSNPFSAYYLAQTNAQIVDFRLARKQSEAAETWLLSALAKTNKKDDSAFIKTLLVSARLLHYSATRFVWAKTICDRWNESMLGKKKNDFVYYDITYPCHGLLQDMMDESGNLKEAYADCWRSENIPYRLNTILGRFDIEFGLWQKLSLKVIDYRIAHATEYVADQSFEELFRPDF